MDGLCGVNCRHTFYPFFDGISEPTKWDKEPEPKQYNGKSYTYTEAEQKMRQMERDVRATKREIEAQQAIGGDTAHLEAMKRRQTIEYHRFCKEMEIRPKDNRLGVTRGSSEYRKKYKNTGNSGTMNKNKVADYLFESNRSFAEDITDIGTVLQAISQTPLRVQYAISDVTIRLG